MLRSVLVPVAVVAFGGAITQTALADGACCLTTANCIIISESNCAAIGDSQWAGEGSDCSDIDEVGIADVCESTAPKIYWLDTSTAKDVLRANLDGSDIEPVITADGSIIAFAIDRPANKIYWAINSRVSRANLNGANVETLIDASMIQSVLGLTIDPPSGLMYLSAHVQSSSGIFAANLDIPENETASNRTDIISVLVSVNAPLLALTFPRESCSRTLNGSNRDGDIDLRDFAIWQACLDGP